MKLCIFCGSSSGDRPGYLAGARELGQAIAGRGFGLVYGGAQVGLMRWSSDVVVAWLSGEPVAEWQNRVREALDDDGVICWGYCQNVPSYLPTDELIPEGGYEVVQSNFHGQDGPGPFAPGLNQIIQSGYRKLASSL